MVIVQLGGGGMVSGRPTAYRRTSSKTNTLLHHLRPLRYRLPPAIKHGFTSNNFTRAEQPSPNNLPTSCTSCYLPIVLLLLLLYYKDMPRNLPVDNALTYLPTCQPTYPPYQP
jgi:hypothetical protein